MKIIFKEKVPGIIKNPINTYQAIYNNDLALKFLFQNNEEIARMSPSFNTEKDKASLLSLILTNQCFEINPQAILSQCNLIVRELNIQFRTFSELVNIESLISILHVLTNKKVPIKIEPNDIKHILKIIFKIAEVPLVIDETSFEPQNQFTFFIQLLIIFDLFSNEIKKLDKPPHKSKTKTSTKKLEQKENLEQTRNLDLTESEFTISYDIIEQEKMIDVALLRTINAIISIETKLSSNKKSIEEVNIIKFVKIFFKKNNDDFFYLTELENDDEKPFSHKINELIQFLSKKEPIFSTYLFNFNDPKLNKSSRTQFFTKFLNYFFLKLPKSKLLERCKTLLFTGIHEKDTIYSVYKSYKNSQLNSDKFIFLYWNVYRALVYFVNKGSIHFIKSKVAKKDYSFDLNNIPKIIDKHYVGKTQIYRDEFGLIYYQLQFILDALDKKDFRYIFVESCLNATSKLKLIKIPNYKTLLDKIVPKNIALIEQKKLYKKHQKLNDDKKVEETKQETSKQEISKQETSKQEICQERDAKVDLNDITILSKDDFWNPVDDAYSFQNGVLYQNNLKPKESWKKIIEEYNNMLTNCNLCWVVTPEDEQENKKVQFVDTPTKNQKSVLYKFFYYNEEAKKWEKNSSSIEQYIKDNFVGHANPDFNVPLVFFSNSYEQDLIKFNSKLIQCSYPELDDDQIYIYALCGKQVSFLKYKILALKKEEFKSPIFLLLHVPQSKMHLKNIKTIVYQIYLYLSIICDIEIVVLNEKYHNEQISLLLDLNYIKNSYKSSVQKRINLRKNIIKSKDSLNFNNQIKPEQNEDEFSSDDDDESFEEEEIPNENVDDSNLKINHDEFSEIDVNVFLKESNLIILFNNELIQSDEVEPEVDFINDTKEKFIYGNEVDINKKEESPEANNINCQIHFINIDKSITFKHFLTSFNNMLIKRLGKIKDPFLLFNNYKMTRISEIYIQWKCEIRYSSNDKLEDAIKKRHEQIKKRENKRSEFEVLEILHKEAIEAGPSIDDKYINDCNTTIRNIRLKESSISQASFLDNLKSISKERLKQLKIMIDKANYWSEQDRFNIKYNYETLMNNSYFDIAKKSLFEKELVHVFNDNLSVLKNVIQSDLKEIDKYFEEFDKIKKLERVINVVGFVDQKKVGTNYMIREKENIREVEIIVNPGEFKEVIESDF